MYYCQESVDSEISTSRESFAREVNSFSENYDLCSEGRQTRQLAAAAEIQQLTRDVEQLEAGQHVNFVSLSPHYKKRRDYYY